MFIKLYIFFVYYCYYWCHLTDLKLNFQKYQNKQKFPCILNELEKLTKQICNTQRIFIFWLEYIETYSMFNAWRNILRICIQCVMEIYCWFLLTFPIWQFSNGTNRSNKKCPIGCSVIDGNYFTCLVFAHSIWLREACHSRLPFVTTLTHSSTTTNRPKKRCFTNTFTVYPCVHNACMRHIWVLNNGKSTVLGTRARVYSKNCTIKHKHICMRYNT